MNTIMMETVPKCLMDIFYFCGAVMQLVLPVTLGAHGRTDSDSSLLLPTLLACMASPSWPLCGH